MALFGYLRDVRKSNLLNLFLRTLQLIDGLVVIGLYGVDLNRANKEDKYADGKWVYAVTIGSLAAVSALLFSLASVFLQYRIVALLFAWDLVLVVLWAALSGIFGTMYLNQKVELDDAMYRMKVAAGFDLAGLILWFLTAAIGTWLFFSERRSAGRVPRDGKP